MIIHTGREGEAVWPAILVGERDVLSVKDIPPIAPSSFPSSLLPLWSDYRHTK